MTNLIWSQPATQIVSLTRFFYYQRKSKLIRWPIFQYIKEMILFAVLAELVILQLIGLNSYIAGFEN